MGGALLFLTVRSARNAVASWVRRLRQPRYAVGLAAGLLFVYASFIRRPSGRPDRPAFGGFAAFAEYHDVVVVIVAALLGAVATLTWLLPRSSRSVPKFLPAEVQFLFPAPIARWRLVRYKVLRSCLQPLVSAAFLTIVFRPVSLGAALIGFAGILVTVETLNFYLVGVALRRQPGIAANLWLPRLVAASAFAAVAVTLGLEWTTLASASTGGGVAAELVRIGTTGIAGAVLSPFRALVRLPLAATPMAFVAAAPTALLLLVVAYRWAASGDISTEAASTGQPADGGVASEPAFVPNTTTRRTPFELAAEGRAEVALLWKNTIATSRVLSARLLLRGIPIMVALLLVVSFAARNMRGGRPLALVATLCVMAVGYVVLFGPQMARNDLRRDLGLLATLKAWPLRGAVVVRGEVLAPAVLLSCLAWVFIAGALALSSNLRFAVGVSWPDRVSIGLALALLTPGLILVQVVMHNAIALVFPAWIHAPNARGVDVAGQRIVTMAALALALALACVPAALAAGLVGFAIRQALGVVPVIVPAAVALVVLVIECGVATEVLGGLFERTDIGALQT